MTEKEVRQALALGRLSPKIRNAWRNGEIKAEVARAFTLGLDHKTQDKVFDKLSKGGTIWESYVKRELGADAIDDDVAQLLSYVGAAAYRDAGGIVTEDLFGNSHIISDETLLKQMARRALDIECEKLKADGWSWAEIISDLPHVARFWSQSQPKELLYEGDEEERAVKLQTEIKHIEDGENFSTDDDEERQAKLEDELEAIVGAVRARSFETKKKKQTGCILSIEDGRLVILYGVKRPAEAKASPASSAFGSAEPSKPAKPKTPAEADEEDISSALTQRLSVQLTKAAATAIIQDEQLALSILIAGFGCYDGCGVKVSVRGIGSRDGCGMLGSEEMDKALALAHRLKPAERISLLAQLAANALDFQGSSLDAADKHDGPMSIVNTIDPRAFNAAARGAFDAKDYFAGVSKLLNLKAIEEALGPDLARQQAKKTKPEIVAFAVENVSPTGWLPPQLRAKGYDGPPVKKAAFAAVTGGKKPAKPKAAGKPPEVSPAMRTALHKARKALKPIKRAAVVRKGTAKKTSKKKR
jgi:ParB family transcriptional regulator, chromosome partitioning protein